MREEMELNEMAKRKEKEGKIMVEEMERKGKEVESAVVIQGLWRRKKARKVMGEKRGIREMREMKGELVYHPPPKGKVGFLIAMNCVFFL